MKLASNGLDRRDDGARLGCRGWAPLVVVHSLTRASLATDACPPPALAATVHFDMELVNSLKVPASYKGVHLTFPLDREQVVNLYKSFRARKRLHAKYVCVCVCVRARARGAAAAAAAPTPLPLTRGTCGVTLQVHYAVAGDVLRARRSQLPHHDGIPH